MRRSLLPRSWSKKGFRLGAPKAARGRLNRIGLRGMPSLRSDPLKPRGPTSVGVSGWNRAPASRNRRPAPPSWGVDAYVAGTPKAVDEAALQDERASRMAPDHQICVAVASPVQPAAAAPRPPAVQPSGGPMAC